MEEFYDASAEMAGVVYGEVEQSTVILLHSLALDHRMWTPEVIARFGENRRLVVCDVPGHGESPLGDSLTIEAIADRVAVLMDGLGIETAAVVGVSMGGCIAQALAIRHARRVSGLGLVDTTSGYHAPQAWRDRAATAREKGFESLADFQVSRWFTDSFLTERPDELGRLLEIFKQMDIDSYEAICQAMGEVDLTDGLQLIECPTAVAVGDSDYATPVEHARIIADRIGGASLQVIGNASHLAVIEQPVAVYDAVEHILGR